MESRLNCTNLLTLLPLSNTSWSPAVSQITSCSPTINRPSTSGNCACLNSTSLPDALPNLFSPGLSQNNPARFTQPLADLSVLILEASQALISALYSIPFVLDCACRKLAIKTKRITFNKAFDCIRMILEWQN